MNRKFTFRFLALIALSFAQAITLRSQTQIGTDILPDAADMEGYLEGLAMDEQGERMVIGTTIFDEERRIYSLVRTYAWNGEAWLPMGGDLHRELREKGSSISVDMSPDGDYVAVGIPRNDPTDGRPGKVHVYAWSGAEWESLGEEIEGEESGIETGDLCGASVALSTSGQRLVIGCPFATGNEAEKAGHAQVFQWDGEGWSKLGQALVGERSFAQAGNAVSISGDGNVLAVGGLKFGDNPSSVTLFGLEDQQWVQKGEDIVSGYSRFFSRWMDLSADGRRLSIGSDFDTFMLRETTSKARVFEWDSDTWKQLGPTLSDAIGHRYASIAVALSGDGTRLAFGIPGADDGGEDSGLVKLLEWRDEGWFQVGNDIPGEAAMQGAGVSAALSADGNRVAFGSFNYIGVKVFSFSTVSTRMLPGSVEWQVYPNPTDGELFFSGIQENRIRVLDALGRTVKIAEWKGASLQISDLADGVYFIQAYIDGFISTKKVVKKRF